MFEDADLGQDDFLGGRLRIWQPLRGYRAAMDPVLLAAACPARSGERVLELGCGAGVASLCLGARVQGLHLTGLELQPEYAALAMRNADDNGIGLRVVTGDLARMPAELRAESFDHVIMNPPYFPAGSGTGARDAGRETGQREATPLSDWLRQGFKRLTPRGVITIIQNADRLPDILAGIGAQGGRVRVLPVAARTGRAAGRVIVQARKGAKTPFVLLPPLVLHAQPEHLADAEDLTEIAQNLLRRGGKLPLDG